MILYVHLLNQKKKISNNEILHPHRYLDNKNYKLKIILLILRLKIKMLIKII
jgi:hypothetical protein